MTTKTHNKFIESVKEILNERYFPTQRMKDIELSKIIAIETSNVIEYMFENPEEFNNFMADGTFPGTSDNIGTWTSIAICLAINEVITGYIKFSQYRSLLKSKTLKLIEKYFPGSYPYWPNIMERCYNYIRSVRNDRNTMQEISKIKENIIRVILDRVNDHELKV